jgi:deoxyadenosine/deoxycytidine kinase
MTNSIPEEALPIGLEAIIGIGKSTVARALHHHEKVGCVLENVEFNPFFQPYYLATMGKKGYKWAFTHMQTFLMGARSMQEATAHTEHGRRFVSDRTLIGDLRFYGVCFMRGWITKTQHDKWLNERALNLLDHFQEKGMFYRTIVRLIASEEIADERLRARGREYEVVPIEYNRDLRIAFDDFVVPEIEKRGIRLVELDWSNDLSSELIMIGGEPVLKKVPEEFYSALRS